MDNILSMTTSQPVAPGIDVEPHPGSPDSPTSTIATSQIGPLYEDTTSQADSAVAWSCSDDESIDREREAIRAGWWIDRFQRSTAKSPDAFTNGELSDNLSVVTESGWHPDDSEPLYLGSDDWFPTHVRNDAVDETGYLRDIDSSNEDEITFSPGTNYSEPLSPLDGVQTAPALPSSFSD